MEVKKSSSKYVVVVNAWSLLSKLGTRHRSYIKIMHVFSLTAK